MCVKGGENTRQVSAGPLYGTEWRGKAKPTFIDHLMMRSEPVPWTSDLLAERESVDRLVALVREGRGAASQTTRRVLVRQRWTDEAKAGLEAVSSEFGLPRNPRAERRKRVLRLMKDLTEQGGLR